MAQLKEGSVIKKVGGDEVIATTNDIPDIPDDAKFTDTTYAEITTAEIDAGRASIAYMTASCT